jgi:hypothetical protein
MFRIIVCSALTLAGVSLLREVGYSSFDVFGFTGGLLFCVVAIGIALLIAVRVDAADRRRREAPRQGPHNFQ